MGWYPKPIYDLYTLLVRPNRRMVLHIRTPS
jgi:hypothetical protein